MTRLLLALLGLLLCSAAFGQSKELTGLLRALERGDVDAVSQLERGHPLQAIEPLGRALSQRDPRLRSAAASALWTLAGTESYQLRIETEAAAALQAALSDPDAIVAMYAASALQSLGRSPDTLIDPRRRVLHADAPVLARFLAARGLIGFESGATLAPALFDFLRESAPAQNSGLIDSTLATTNLKLAHGAIERLLRDDAPSAIRALLPELDSSDPAVASLLVLLDTQHEGIPDWTEHLMRQVDSTNPKAQERAWTLLGKQNEPALAAKWVGLAAARLGASEQTTEILGALRDQAGASPDAYPALAELAADRTRPENQRLLALNAIRVATEETLTRAGAASQASAREQGMRVARGILLDESTSRELRHAARYATRSMEPDDTQRAAWLADVLLALSNPQHQLALLEAVREVGYAARPSLDALRPLLDSPDDSVRLATRSTLDAIDPAWQARDVRASVPLATLQQVPPKAPRPAPLQVEHDPRPATKSGPRPSLAALYDAIRATDLKAFRAQLDAGLPINTPQKLAPVAQFEITPLQAVVDFCHHTTLIDGETLLAMAALLLERGADPGIKGSRDRSALESAFDSQCPEPLRLLLQGG